MEGNANAQQSDWLFVGPDSASIRGLVELSDGTLLAATWDGL